MLQFMGDNKKLLHTHEQKFAELEALKSKSKKFQSNTNSSLKNLETQVGQLALTLQNQNKNAFPSDTQKNPKDCMAVQLRSGKEMSNSRAEEKEKTDKKKRKQLEEIMEGARQRRLQKQKSRCTLSSLRKAVSRNRRRRLKFTPLQSHFHRGFRKQRRKNNFLNSWKISRK